jgi:alpha-glucosidase
MARPWDAEKLRESIDATLAAHAPVNAPSTWVLSNHDVTRPVTRYGRDDSSFAFASKRFGTPVDLELGERRARAAALLTAALPGALYIYQGDELGLPEVEDLPLDQLQDPMHFRSNGVDPGRDGCRVPLPWSGSAPGLGFGPEGAAAPWLPQPASWQKLAVEEQEADQSSMLRLYREALRIRAASPELHGPEFAWIASPNGVLSFSRGDRFVSVTNLSSAAIDLPDHAEILISSAGLLSGRLPPDSSAWLQTQQ